ncbi:hypothetical protein [Luteimonas changyuni]|uniref:hypothetical protein n=1 Tax=Luteimonas sp. MJ145 TaxID=3129234 RepID=UPI0031BB84C0
MLFIVLMLGVAVGTSTLLIWHAVRSTQEQQLTIHASTPAQASAWRGVEVLRRWLDAVDESALDGWADAGGVVPVAFGGAGDPGFSAGLTSVRKDGSAWRVEAAVTGLAAEGGAAQSRATVEVVYEIEPGEAGGGGGGSAPAGVVSAINIHRDLRLTGSIKVTGAENAVFNVDGDALLDSASITGIDTLRATGDITVGSNIHVRNIHSNGDVVLRGSASGTQVRARGGATVSGGSSPVALRANGPVLFTGGAGDLVESKTGVTVTGGGVNITSVRSEGPVNWTGGGGGANRVHANGRVDYSGGNRSTVLRSRAAVALPAGEVSEVAANGRVTHGAYGKVGSITAIGDVDMGKAGAGRVRTQGTTRVSGYGGIDALEGQRDLVVSGWVSIAGVIGGAVSGNGRDSVAKTVRVQPGYTVPIAPVEPVVVDEVPEVVMPSSQVDAWPLRELANYVFEVVGDQRRVTVANVAGIPDGQYVLGIKAVSKQRYPDWLCRNEDLDRTSGVCSVPVATICQGYSPQNGCIGGSGGRWEINGKSMARGVAWFDGDLTVGNGVYVNTFIATGNIATSGSHRNMSPNYAGFAVSCANATPPGGSAAPDFAQLVPVNLCNLAGGTMTGAPVANIAYLAGGTAPGSGGFSGGDITLGASTRADGSVLAGNVLTTGGSTTISGAIVSAAQGGGSDVSMGGSTTLDLSGGSEDYDPGGLPCRIVECAEDAGTDPEARRTQVLWTRYR